MKNFKKIIALILAVLTMTALLASCNNEETASGTVTVVVAGKETHEYEVSLDGLDTSSGLVSVLDALKSDGRLDYGITNSMLDYVGEVKNNYETEEYICIYTSVTEDHDVSEWKKTTDYKGTPLVSSIVGALDMTMKDGALIYIKAIKW